MVCLVVICLVVAPYRFITTLVCMDYIIFCKFEYETPLAQIKENKMNSAVIGGVVVVMIVIIVSIASKKKTK